MVTLLVILRPTPFQSTLPVWGATYALICDQWFRDISIHAPRVGSDRCDCGKEIVVLQFQSTLPVWGATMDAWDDLSGLQFQSTLPVWGATRS